MDDSFDEIADSGEHTPAWYVRAVLERSATGATGELRIIHGDDERSVFFVEGRLLSITSTVPNEELVESLVSSGLVDSSRIDWIEKHCGPDEGIIEALLAAGTLSRQELCTHVEKQLQVMLGANLRWASGEWEWVPAAQEVARSFDPDLIPNLDLFAAFVDGVRSTFAANALNEWISDEGAGAYIADARLTGATLPGWFPNRYEDIPGRFTSGAAGAALLDADEDLAFPAVLWILEAVGLVHRRNPPATLVPSDTIITFRKAAPDAEQPEGSKPARTARKRRRSARVAASNNKAAAASSAPTAAPESVESGEGTAPSVEPEVKTQQTGKTAEKTKADVPAKPTKRRKVKVKKPQRVLSLAEIQERMEDGDFETALSNLEKLRNEDPSSPDILAALGWASWRVGAQGTNAYDGPEDYLLLALTFDAEHPKALEYFARIAIETGDVENARNRLLQVLQVDPNAEWARAALDSDSLSAKTRTPRGRGLRFWPRGKA